MFENISDEIPPKTHDLMKLAIKSEVFDDLSEKYVMLLKELQPLNIEARYPDYKETVAETMTAEKTARIFKETEAFLCWIKNRLGR